MDVFELRNHLVEDYGSYVRSFIRIRDARIEEQVRQSIEEGLLWPDPLIQLNPSFEAGETIDELVGEGILHEECARVFRKGKKPKEPHNPGEDLRLHRHQAEAIRTARGGHNYVLTTGTGSGKSLAYIVPVVDHVLRRGPGRGVQAIVVYPMNALANSQYGELEKFLKYGYPDGQGPVTFARYTGQESDEERQRIIADPPDILLTNYVMLELILTRSYERGLVQAAQDLGFLVFDELHTYRGRQGADVAFLIRRVRELLAAQDLRCVGTSATIAGSGTYEEQRAEISDVATRLFGAEVRPENVIGETLRRATPERDHEAPEFIAELTSRIENEGRTPPTEYGAFTCDPLSVWIESTFGVAGEPGTGRLVRAQPVSISGPEGAAKRLSGLTGLPEERCASAIQEGLLAGYECEPEEESTGRPPFAFRLHQFVSRGDAVYASIEEEHTRYITLKGQQFVPGRGRWNHAWLFAWRNVTNNVSERTVIVSFLPYAAVGHSAPLVLPEVRPEYITGLATNLAVFVLDYLTRQKISGANLTYSVLSQIPVLQPGMYSMRTPWAIDLTLSEWLVPRALELTYTAWDLEPFARDLGYDGPPFRWDPERRLLLRCELDAAFFHLYGIGRDDVDYIMETFPIVKRKDEAAHGEYRTKRVILEIYDQMARAAETGQPYRTPLDPPPAELDLPASEPAPATVTPLRQHTQPEPDRPPLDRRAEERIVYEVRSPGSRDSEPEQQANGTVEPDTAEEVLFVTDSSTGPVLEEPQDGLFEHPAPEVITLDDAALALHACVPDGEKVDRHTLLLDAARELGQAKLTKKVRRALNQALNAEHNAGRLRTDWERVWKPRKK